MTGIANIENALAAKAKACTARVSKIEHVGKSYWVKRPEQLSLRMRLQKGSSEKAFNCERRALCELADLGAPVPRIIAEGDDFFVLEDCGVSLMSILRNQNHMNIAAQKQAFFDTGKALAKLHNMRLTHGRPSLRDICWHNGRVTFIDLENYNADHNNRLGHGRDLVMFFFNAFSIAGRTMDEFAIVRDAYRTNDTRDNWAAAKQIAKRMRWTNLLSKPLQMRREGKAKEFKAIPLTLDWFSS